MASITRIDNKNGLSYKIRVSCGYDSKNKKIVKTLTYRPDPSKTEKQQAKDAQRYADEEERKIKDGINLDGKKITFEQFSGDWLERRKSKLRFNTLPETIVPLIKQYRSEYDAYRLSLGNKWQGQGNLFIQPDGKLMGMATPYHRLKRHIKQYNAWVERQNSQFGNEEPKLEPLTDISLHGLRHSCATWLNHIDVNILVISKILGHAQVSTTMNIYAHGFQSQLCEASTKMNADWANRTGQSEKKAVG